jgi:hypothetical protein
MARMANPIRQIDVPLPLMQKAVTAVMAFLLRKPPNQLVEVDDAEFVEVEERNGWLRVNFTFKYRPAGNRKSANQTEQR